MNRYGYTIRDVTESLKNYIIAKDLQVRVEGIDVRVKIYTSYPEAMISKQYIPGLCIETGYIISIPEWFQKECMSYSINSSDNDLVDITTERFIDITYGYKIGTYAYFNTHNDYFIQNLLLMFPYKFYLDVVDDSGNSYKLDFKRDSGLVKMDETIDNKHIYRRDLILTTKLLMKDTIVESLLRPFNGITIETLSEVQF